MRTAPGGSGLRARPPLWTRSLYARKLRELLRRAREQGASGFPVGGVHEDLARAVGGKAVERRVRLLGHPMTARDPVRAEQSTQGLGFRLAGHRGHGNASFHIPKASAPGSYVALSAPGRAQPPSSSVAGL